MNEQHVKSSQQWAAITSLCLSGLSFLMVVLALAFGSSVSAMLTYLRHEQYPSSPLIAIVLLLPIFFPSLLAIILSFVAKSRSTKRLVLSARILSSAVFILNLLTCPYLLLSLYWFDAPVPCG
jgi:hypothetical protein